MLRRNARIPITGMTIIELMVVLVILAGITSAGVIVFQSTSRSKLKAQTLHLSGMIQYTYAQAIVRQQHYRLVFDLNGAQYWVELAGKNRPGAPPVVPDDNLIGAPDSYESKPKYQIESNKKDDIFGISRPKFEKSTDDPLLKRRDLKEGIKVFAIYTHAAEGAIESGRASITFFPNGFVEQSVIIVGDENKNYQTMEIQPLSGKVFIKNGKEEPSYDFFDPEEDR